MATNNIKIFDENKSNIMPSEEYGTNSQRLNGVQQGIASSMLQNKTLYQLSLVAYAIGQMMVNNGLDANDDNAVSAFVGNLANTIVQKVVDKASTAEAQAGADANKFMTPATTRAAINVLKATSGMATAGTDNTHWMTPALVKQVINDNTKWNIIANNTTVYLDGAVSVYYNIISYIPNILNYDEVLINIVVTAVGSVKYSLSDVAIVGSNDHGAEASFVLSNYAGGANADKYSAHITKFKDSYMLYGSYFGNNIYPIFGTISQIKLSIFNENKANVTFYCIARNRIVG